MKTKQIIYYFKWGLRLLKGLRLLFLSNFPNATFIQEFKSIQDNSVIYNLIYLIGQ